MLLVKYFGLVNEESNYTEPRSSFLSDGLFRFTQPKFLNDKMSEAKLFPYFNEFSPADLDWAKERFQKDGGDINDSLDLALLKKFYLERPLDDRYGDAFPHLVESQFGYSSMKEFDKEQVNKKVQEINNQIIEKISAACGVFSLCKSVTSTHMWNHYASEGQGVALIFDETHEFFMRNIVEDVTYEISKRASVTYYRGSWRINGMPVKDWNSINKPEHLNDLMYKLLFSKSPDWEQEEESRIVCSLVDCDEAKGKFFEFYDSSVDKLHKYHECYLKKIPFSAFNTLVLGYGVAPEHKKSIIDRIKANTELAHLKLKSAEYDIFGELELIDIEY